MGRIGIIVCTCFLVVGCSTSEKQDAAIERLPIDLCIVRTNRNIFHPSGKAKESFRTIRALNPTDDLNGCGLIAKETGWGRTFGMGHYSNFDLFSAGQRIGHVRGGIYIADNQIDSAAIYGIWKELRRNSKLRNKVTH